MSFDAILDHVGSHGRYQMIVFIATSAVMMLHGMVANLPVLITYKQKYRCAWLDNDTTTFSANSSLIYDTCDIYSNTTPEVKIKCSDWNFDQSVFNTTIRSRYDLTCGMDFLAELSTTIFFLGFVIGSMPYGMLSDRYGRMIGMVAASTHLAIFSFAATFVNSYTMFAILKFVAGMGHGGMLSCAFTMMTEVTDKTYRVIYIQMSFHSYSMGVCIMALLGYFVKEEFAIQLIVAFSILIVWSFPFVMPESPRWLVCTGRLDRAKKALKYVSQINRRSIPADVHDLIFRAKLQSDEEAIQESVRKNEASLMDLMRRKSLCVATLLTWYSWFAVSTGFFAVVYTLGDIGGNLFLNLFYSAIIEIPARLIATYFANRWGRIPVIAVSLIVGGLGCLLNAIFICFPSFKTAIIVASVVNKFWLTSAFDILWAYTGEFFPTVIRNRGVGASSMWARIGGMVAPQVSLLFDVWLPLPLILIGIFPFIAGIGFFMLPETLNKGTLEEIDDMVQIIEENSRLWKPKNKAVATEETDDNDLVAKL